MAQTVFLKWVLEKKRELGGDWEQESINGENRFALYMWLPKQEDENPGKHSENVSIFLIKLVSESEWEKVGTRFTALWVVKNRYFSKNGRSILGRRNQDL